MRLIQVILPGHHDAELQQAFEDEALETFGVWPASLDDGNVMYTILVASDSAETIMDRFTRQFEHVTNFRMILLTVEATLPRPTLREEEPAQQAAEQQDTHVGREELYQDVVAALRPWPVLLLLVALTAIVIAFGLAQNNVTIVIGGMVLSPLLGSQIALSLATALADLDLGRRALAATALGTLAAFVVAMLIGLVFDISPDEQLIVRNSQVDLGSIGLALSAGSAGALAFTTGVPQALVGVAVAVALLPPLVTAGILAGVGAWTPALRALLVFTVNIVGINLAGVLVFIAQGVRPVEWRESKYATFRIIALWAVLLAILIAALLLVR